MTLSPDIFARVKAAVFANGRDDSNEGLHHHLHRVAVDSVHCALDDEDVDPDSVDADQLEELAIEYKGGFWDLCHEDERKQGKAALAFLAELLECGTLDPLAEGNPDMHARIAELVAGAVPVDNGAKALGVLGRLHDGLSDMIEGGRLREADIPEDYQWLVNLLVNESLPLFAGQSERKAVSVPEGFVLVPASLWSAVGGFVGGVLAGDWSPDSMAEEAQEVSDRMQRITGSGDPVAVAAPEWKPVDSYKVYLCVEPVDAEGDTAGYDLDLPFASSGEFKTAEAAIQFATEMHEGSAVLPSYLLRKWAGLAIDCPETSGDIYAPAFECKCTLCELLRETQAAVRHIPGGDWHEMRRVLVLSSMHLEGQTILEFEGTPPADRVFRLWDFDSGWVCKLPSREELEGQFSPDLLAVFEHARAMGLRDYDLIVFDCDGGQVPNLPLYSSDE